MPHTFPPETRQQLLAQLHNALDASTIQTLRQAARGWGWPLKGLAKADIVTQMLAYLSDAEGMSASISTLPQDEREILGWLSALSIATNPAKPVQVALEKASSRKLTQKAIGLLLQNLLARGLVFANAQGGYTVPRLFLEWLPALDAPELRYPDEPIAAPPFTVATLNQHLQHLLFSIETDQPTIAAPVAVAPGPLTRSPAAAPRPGLAPAETLSRWSYYTGDERHLACFLLEQLLNNDLCILEQHSGKRRLVPQTPAVNAWEVLSPLARLDQLRQRWLAPPQAKAPPGNTWNELDLALHRVHPYTLHPSYYWSQIDQLNAPVHTLRGWLLSVVQGLRTDAWYSIARLGELVYQIHRDLLAWEGAIYPWRWQRKDAALDTHQMSLEEWLATYGKLIEAWLVGPASWLLFVQVGYQAGEPVAFRVPSQTPAGEAASLPRDALRFPTAETALLQNTWQTGELRQLLRRIAAETARDRDTTTFRLDVAAFRHTLQAGGSAHQLGEAFAATGFPLPHATADILHTWQVRAGRYQLYDHLAVIELNPEMHPEEARAIAGMGISHCYQASPHCLIVLDPDSVPKIIDELLRRGYTPQVIS